MSRNSTKDRVFLNLKQARELHLSGRGTEAEELLKMILRELDPDNAEAHRLLGLIYEQKGDFENSLKEYRLAARNGIVAWREQDYQSIKTGLNNLEDFNKEDLRDFISETTNINGTIYPVAIDYIVNNFDVVKREIVKVWKQDSVSDSAIISAFENLKGTFAAPGLISKILFLKDKNQFNICTSLLVKAMTKIGLFNQMRARNYWAEGEGGSRWCRCCGR